MSRGTPLAGRRFAVRFLGRPATWVWLAATLLPGIVAWYLVAVPAEGVPGRERTWFLWSGNVVLALFLATVLFSARKWSIKLPWFRDFGRARGGTGDAAWSEVQELNRKARQGAFGSDEELRRAADALLRRHGTHRVQRAEVRRLELAGRTTSYVELRKREPFGRLEAWLEMHMGVGTAGCVGVVFHADFVIRHPLGWVLFVGSMVVLLTGVLGAALFRLVPERLARADAQIPYEEAGVARGMYQTCVDGVLAALPEGLRAEVREVHDGARTFEELRERSERVLSRAAATHPAEAELVRDLCVMAGSRDYLGWSTAEARRLDLWLKVWRWVHVPVSVALLCAVALHVWAVLWY